ncbi:MAG: MurR/RpiR family transcriptional regulator [Firmicutes bacterium]|nr:MurR/RpiR family transcriptional regulator [Bacillota bacterium]
MNHHILSILQEREPTFSKGQRRIASYILQSYDKAAFMTASKLGKAVGVSESTVVRFAVELGFDGYPEMQKAMQETVVNHLTSVQRMEVANDRIADRDPVSAVLHADIELLRRTEEMVSRSDFQSAVEAILNAKRIYILGTRSSSTLAYFLSYYLNYMFPNVHLVSDTGSGTLFERIIGVNSEDVVIAYSFPRYSTSTAKGVQFCLSTGATVIGITDNAQSPVGQSCTYCLLAKSDMQSLADSLVAPLSLTNALLVALTARKEKELAATFEELERVWAAYDVYDRRDTAK